MDFSFRTFLESDEDVLSSVRVGDDLAFFAYLDKLEERGDVPEELAVWRNPQVIEPPYHVRYFSPGRESDVRQVVTIEKLGSPDPMGRSEILKMADSGRHVVRVAETLPQGERKGLIVGYSITDVGNMYHQIERLVVHPMARRRGVGKAIVDVLKNDLMIRNPYWARGSISVHHPPEAEEFLRKQGFVKSLAGSTFRPS